MFKRIKSDESSEEVVLVKRYYEKEFREKAMILMGIDLLEMAGVSARVAACVVIVTLLMMVMTVVGYRIGMPGGVQITLFPMIILAWTIERMSLIWEEEGKRSAITQVAGSVVVAVTCYEMTGLGYLGVDVMIDESLGPLMIEVNARPGLAIQMANGVGLKRRLEPVEKQHAMHPGAGLREKSSFSMENFAALY